MTIEKCPITLYPFKKDELKPATSSTIEYETEFVGKVKITIPAYQELITGEYDKFIFAGICKHRTLENKEPILIDINFLKSGYKSLNPPLDFEEKIYHLLKYLYVNGGRENHEFELYSTRDFALAYASQEEFTRIITQLENEYYITIRKKHKIGGGKSALLFMGINLTSLGKEQAKKSLPKMPLFGLISQQISTGDPETDDKVNHAKKLFFADNATMDDMRSACETLSYILEPFRRDLSRFFTNKDVNDFFQIVNTFDIRHNKENTKDLIYPEQLEWVFYTLLNTINTYIKLKSKLE